MSDLMVRTEPTPLLSPRVEITIRPGVIDDVPFLDSLQKKTTKQVGWMPTTQFEGKIRAGHVLIACATEESGEKREERKDQYASSLSSLDSLLSSRPVGYLIGNDQYFKRDDVGIIYQINVIPEMRRSLVAASLLKAQFERSAYGCKLYCCWCAQDIEANRFWEAMGFVALAFRAGSEKKARVHIFWQKRIRQGDETTPWWFPSKTNAGAIREDRIVLPIPPGTRWSEEMPVLLPNAECRLPNEESKKLPCVSNRKSAIDNRQSKQPPPVRRNGLLWDIPKQGEPLPEEKPQKKPKPKEERPKRVADPKLVSAARELRDRWLEKVNEDPSAVLGRGKYDVSRTIAPGAGAPLLAA